ncbi:MAG TPA: LemA family protein [Burkholderiaceae bacterium]|nr:LemA family protein [Burkholderiaceae bacterium]HRP27500.1 LemA family protein [Burkholderiaceae bacterium]
MLNIPPEHAGFALVAVLGFWILGAHNRLVRLRQTVANAFAQVDVHLRQRHEQLGELLEAVAPLQADAPEAVAAVEAARLAARRAADHVAKRAKQSDRLAQLAMAENALRVEVSRLITLVKTQPALRSDPRLRSAMKQLSATQHRLSAARDSFNATVLQHNRSVRQFPTRLVAAMFGFGEASEL